MVETSQQLLDVSAALRRCELVDDVQRRLVVAAADVDVHTGLPGGANSGITHAHIHPSGR